jgi:hypothetical protein
LSNSIAQSIKKVEAEIDSIEVPDTIQTFPKIVKAHEDVLETTGRAERNSTKKNWRKLDQARRKLAKELDKNEFDSYTSYVDFVSSQGIGGARRRELLITRDELLAQKSEAEKNAKSLRTLTPAQIITVLADVLSRCPHTPVGPLPIVIDDALRNVEVSTKLRAMEVLKAHASHYATWYITDDPVVLSWAGFMVHNEVTDAKKSTAVYDIDVEIAS